MASEKVGAHTLGPIEARLKRGTYASDSAAATRNLGLLHQVVDTPKVWKETKERATELIRSVRAASERREAPAPAAVAAAAAAAAATESKASLVDEKIAKITRRSAAGFYNEHVKKLEKDIITLTKFRNSIDKRETLGISLPHNVTKRPVILGLLARLEEIRSALAPAADAGPVLANSFSAAAAAAEAGPVTLEEYIPPLALETRTAVSSIREACPQLYDPCTQAPLPSIAALEKRVREIKKQADMTPAGLYGLTNATSNFDFLMGPFLDKTISLEDLVSFKLHAKSYAGADIYEVLSRMFVFFGGIKDVNPQQGGNFHYMEKAEAAVPHVFIDPRQAFQEMKCKASSKYGVSDITLVRTASAAGEIRMDKPYCESECDIPADGIIRTYLMSVKWYKDEKNAEHYDLEKLKATADNPAVLSPEQRPYGIIVFLKSKRDFERAHQRASRQYIRHIGNTYFGWEEDVKPFLQDIRRQIFEEAELRGTDPRQIMNDRYFVAGAKPSLGLQLHQEIITKSVCDALRANEANEDNNHYLIGVLPRGGKTYIAGGIIREYMRTRPPALNILWLTAAPTETLSQVGKDLIEKFQDFADFEFIYVRDSAEFKKTTAKPYSFFFCSTQLLTQPKAGIERKNRKYLEELLTKPGELGLIFYDEAHKTATGTKTREEVDNILKAYESIKLPLIFLTATYYNILFEYRILPEKTFIWDYTDVLKTRGLASESDQEGAVQNLRDRFRNSALVDSILDRRRLNGEPISAMGKPYLEFPDLYFISADFQTEALERFDRQGAYRPNSGFSMSAIFGTRPEASLASIKTASGGIRADAYNVFIDIVNARNMISLITPTTEEFGDGLEGGVPLTQENPLLEPTLLGRINALSRTMDSRFRLDHNPTLLMFMPTGGAGSSIYRTICAWAALLMKHPWWKARYEVACVVDQQSHTPEELAEAAGLPDIAEPGIHILKLDPKAEIMKLERHLHCPVAGSPSKGLVILAGQKLSMGVSLPCTDVVFLFNDSKSPDDIIQKMYRGLTPSPGKKAAFVVDLNPVRSLAAVYGYTRTANVAANTSKAILDIIYDTYSWDADVFDIALSKGAAARPQRFQDKLRQLFDKAAADPDYRIYEEFGGLERRLETNIRSRLDTEYVKSLTAHFTEKRGSTGPVIELRDGARATMKAGKLLLQIPKAAPSAGAAAAAGAAESEPDVTEIVIDNFIETVSDFVKYLAITTSKATLEEALREYEHTLDFKHNVDQLLYDRADMKGIDPMILGHILVSAVRNFSIGSSEAMFRQMKGVVDDSETRKNAILKVINKRLTPRQKQRKDHGEVFTPLELVNDMLDHLPKAVWSNPELKWLDPANGIGNFPVAVFYRLDEGLKTVKPEAAPRRKHIIENMLYMIELQSSNNRIAKNIFTKLCSGCEPNILTRDTLTVTPEVLAAKSWPAQFDIVMGNPPFQAFQKADGKRGGGDELYMSFVKKSIDLLKANGYLVFVHPPSWRKPEFNEGRKKSKNLGMFNLMAHDNQMEYLEIHSSVDGMKVFKAGTRYDFYTLKKIKAHTTTSVKDINGKIEDIDLRSFDFLPNSNIINVQKLFPSDADETCDLNSCIMFERSAYGSDKHWVSAIETAEYKYPLIHSTNKDGMRLLYSSTNDRGFFGIPKVIFGESGINDPVIDIEGKYGMSQGAMAIRIKNQPEGTRLAAFLKSNFFKNILNSCMWGSFRIDWRLFTYFKNYFWDIEVDLDESLMAEVDEAPVAEGGYRRFRHNRTRKIRR